LNKRGRSPPPDSYNKRPHRSDGPKRSNTAYPGEEEISHHELARREEEFQVKQAIIRAEKRIKEGRGAPIDFLFAVVHFPEGFDDYIIIPPPTEVIYAATTEELQSLLEDIPRSDSINYAYWNSLVALVQKALTNKSRLLLGEEDDNAIHSTVVEDIDALLSKKSTEHLLRLELQIQADIDTGKVIDEEFWVALLNRLRTFKAFTKVTQIHKEMVDTRMETLARKGMGPDELESLKSSFFQPVQQPMETEPEAPAASAAQSGKGRKRMLSDVEMYKDEEARGETEDEQKFNREIELEDTSGRTDLKKPKHYNRVRHWVDWNRHNAIKFGHGEKKPPKVVLGYKFNLFYPELENPTKAPTYQLIPTENPDMVVIVFKAGAPYKDIAFKIVNHEWEFSQKKGYRCDFSNGIMHLHFNFKRYKYRR